MASQTRTQGGRVLIRQDLRFVGAINLKGDRVTIGRGANCNITLDHPSVSRQHAYLARRGERWHILDAHSTNGVLVNQQPVNDAPLQSGDTIDIKPFSLTYFAEDEDSADPSIRLSEGRPLATTARSSVPSTIQVQQRLDELYTLAHLILKRDEEHSPWRPFQLALKRSLSAERCLLLGYDESIGLYRLDPDDRRSTPTEQLGLSSSILREVITTLQAVLVECAQTDSRFGHAESLADGVIGSVICAPVVVGDRVRAIVYADRSVTRKPFQTEDLEFVAAATDLAAATVKLDELQEQARELARVQGRIETAREIQELLLPSPIPQPGWGHVAALNVPADQMSGDIYDAAIDSSGRLVVTLADVVGKGVPAAFLAALLQNTMRLSLFDDTGLNQIVARVNAVIAARSPEESFVTMVACRWSADGRTVEAVNAGHLAPLWLKHDGAVEVYPSCTSIPLGIEPDWKSEVALYDASKTAAMLLYSDGVTETRSASKAQYGEERLCEVLSNVGRFGAKDICRSISAGVVDFCLPDEPEDDVTLLAVTRADA